MSWDIFFVAADTPPPPVDEMPDHWRGCLIGTLEQVRARISTLFPGTDWSDPTWGVYEGGGFSLEFSVGEQDPCDGFAVHVRGGGEASAAVMRIAAVPGWYGTDSAQGEWLHHVENPGSSWLEFQNFRDHALQEIETKPGSGAGGPDGIWPRLKSWFAQV